METKTDRLFIIIPAYNERENIRQVLDDWYPVIQAHSGNGESRLVVIDLGTLTDEYEKEISIHTTATSKDGEKTILAGKEVTIVDTVKLDGLTKGTKYQLKGWQMLKEETIKGISW